MEKDGEAVAYPFGILNDDPVVNDKVGDQLVLVVFNADTGTGVVFDRQVDNQTLNFSLGEELTLTDAETGTLWDGLTGLALDGPLAGEILTRLKSTASFWFGWKDWYPDTRVYTIEE